ncbi:MAG: endolytic transglycosylase MltG [Candidatus Shapirobacteria bacterium]
MKKAYLWGIAVAVFLLAILLAALSWYYFQPADPNYSGGSKVFVVKKGEGSGQIGIRLQKENLIRHRYAFWLAVEIYDLNGKLQAGSFRLLPNMSLKQIGLVLTQGRLDQWVTIIEGLRREEIAWILAQKMPISIEDFLVASEGKEGHLFPDTYLVPETASAERVVEILTANFGQKTEGLWPKAEERGLGQKDVIVLASLVEREAKSDADRRIVAGILIKRLENNWPLQIDATVQYVKAGKECVISQDCRWWPTVISEDLSLESAYNTYKNTFLPPGPICNPSLSSLQAVVSYQTSDYWFYISDQQGEIHFSKTLEEHQENIRKYL